MPAKYAVCLQIAHWIHSGIRAISELQTLKLNMAFLVVVSVCFCSSTESIVKEDMIRENPLKVKSEQIPPLHQE